MPDSTALAGLGLPALRRSGGYFASKSKYDVAFSDIMTACFTPIGSRPMRRRFGSALHLVLFEPANITTDRLIDHAVREAVGIYCPHLYVVSVQTAVRGQEIVMGVTFGLVSERINQDRVVLLSNSDANKLLAARANQ